MLYTVFLHDAEDEDEAPALERTSSNKRNLDEGGDLDTNVKVARVGDDTSA